MDFDDFIESLESLPIDLSRNLRLLRELDDKCLSLKGECATLGGKYQHSHSHDDKYQLIQTLNDLQSRRLLHADEKITLANQAYEMVEKHIRRLDDVLEELAAQPAATAAPSANRKKKRTISSNEELTNNKKRRKLDKPLNQVQNRTSMKKKEHQQETHKVEPVGLDMFPIDPYEPRYCICNQVSFGRMVACDNPQCQIEWFHFACVKLEEEPKGKWFCDKCRAISK